MDEAWQHMASFKAKSDGREFEAQKKLADGYVVMRVFDHVDESTCTLYHDDMVPHSTYEVSLDGGYRGFKHWFMSWFRKEPRPTFCDNFRYYRNLTYKAAQKWADWHDEKMHRVTQTERAVRQCE